MQITMQHKLCKLYELFYNITPVFFLFTFLHAIVHISVPVVGCIVAYSLSVVGVLMAAANPQKFLSAKLLEPCPDTNQPQNQTNTKWTERHLFSFYVRSFRIPTAAQNHRPTRRAHYAQTNTAFHWNSFDASLTSIYVRLQLSSLALSLSPPLFLSTLMVSPSLSIFAFRFRARMYSSGIEYALCSGASVLPTVCKPKRHATKNVCNHQVTTHFGRNSFGELVVRCLV